MTYNTSWRRSPNKREKVGRKYSMINGLIHILMTVYLLYIHDHNNHSFIFDMLMNQFDGIAEEWKKVSPQYSIQISLVVVVSIIFGVMQMLISLNFLAPGWEERRPDGAFNWLVPVILSFGSYMYIFFPTSIMGGTHGDFIFSNPVGVIVGQSVIVYLFDLNAKTFYVSLVRIIK